MAQIRLKVCQYCQRTVAGRCEACLGQRQRESVAVHDKQRGSAASRGYDHRWRKARALFLKRHPWCLECLKNEKRKLADVVDHIIPHRGDKKLFWDRSNWQPLCKRHHDMKTRKGL